MSSQAALSISKDTLPPADEGNKENPQTFQFVVSKSTTSASGLSNISRNVINFHRLSTIPALSSVPHGYDVLKVFTLSCPVNESFLNPLSCSFHPDLSVKSLMLGSDLI